MILLSVCGYIFPTENVESLQQTTTGKEKPPIWITVFIHGTLGLRYTLGPYTLLRLLLDNIQGTEYAYTVCYIRQNPIFYKNQCMYRTGLYPIADMSEHAIGPCMLQYAYDAMQQAFAPRPCAYYTFGWSGLLSERERRNAGYALYPQLKQVRQSWIDAGYTPHISILGYSHGGTAAEYLALAQACDHSGTSFDVDELILLGTPIQRTSNTYASWPIFKRVYNIYSEADFFQKFDIISMPSVVPRRRLKPKAQTTAKTKIYQIKLRITTPKKGGDGTYRYFATGRQRRYYDPGHIELYFFGWSKSSWLYRANFPLRPLPAAVLVPALLSYQDHFPDDEVVCDVWPVENRLRIRPQESCRWSMHTFPLDDALQQITDAISRYRPGISIEHVSDVAARKARDIANDVREDIYSSSTTACQIRTNSS